MADETALYQLKFTTNLQAELQARESLLYNTVEHGSYAGAKQAQLVDTIGTIEMQRRTGKYTPLTPTEITTDQRWLDPEMWDLTQYCERFDQLKTAVDIRSGKLQAAAYAIKRKFDDIIMAAFFASAKTGENAGTTTVFGSAQYVSVNEGGTGSGLNVDKLLAVEQLFLENYIDLNYEKLFCYISPKQHRRLKEEIKLTSGDYNKSYTLDQAGMLTNWGNFNFIIGNGLLTGTDDQSGADRYMVPVWVKSGMHLGTWEGPTTTINQRIELSGQPWQIYNQLYCGATRVEEKKVARIWCV
jgi:hypothetical protein